MFTIATLLNNVLLFIFTYIKLLQSSMEIHEFFYNAADERFWLIAYSLPLKIPKYLSIRNFLHESFIEMHDSVYFVTESNVCTCSKKSQQNDQPVESERYVIYVYDCK